MTKQESGWKTLADYKPTLETFKAIEEVPNEAQVFVVKGPFIFAVESFDAAQCEGTETFMFIIPGRLVGKIEEDQTITWLIKEGGESDRGATEEAL